MKILIAGDVVPNTDFNFGNSFLDLLNEHDVRICNLEGALSTHNTPIHKAGPHILLIEEYLSKLANYFNIFTLANNHSMDYGSDGLFTTIQQCIKLNVGFCGAGINLHSALQPLRYKNLSIISVAENEFGAAQSNKPGIASVEYGREIYNVIRNEVNNNQRVIVIVHGGTEIIPIPPPYFRNRLQLYKDYGASLVIGNHPHVPQGKEENIYYSLGNFIFLSADFSQYFNYDWSIVLSYDLENNTCTEYFTTVQNKTVELIDKNEQFILLCKAIQSEDYQNIYTRIANELYIRWYGELQTHAYAYLLHHIRCDAHRNIVERALASRIGEYDNNTTRFNVDVINSDGIKINEI